MATLRRAEVVSRTFRDRLIAAKYFGDCAIACQARTPNWAQAILRRHTRTCPARSAVAVADSLNGTSDTRPRHQPRTVDFSLKPLSAATFGDDVPVMRAWSPLLQLLAEGEQIKAGK